MTTRLYDAQDFQQNEARNMRLQNLGSAPGTPVEGQVWWDSVGHTAKAWDGSAVVSLGSAVVYATPTLTFGTANAGGAAASTIRSDATLAIFDATNPSTQAFGDAAAVGSAAFAARRDHKHAMMANPTPAFAAPTIALGTAAATGAAGTIIRSDATIAAFDATVPVTQAFGDAAATGSVAFAARRDHTHGMPANPVSYAAPALTLTTANAAGAATTLMRSDASIAIFDATNPSTQAFGDAAAVGAAAFAARRDHKHAMPAHDGAAHSAIVLNNLANATGNYNMGGFKITGAADGTAATDYATFGQLTAIIEGKISKDAVMVASTANLGLTGLAAIDGYTPSAGDRVLAKDQTAPAENGLYVAAAGAWARAADMNTAAEFKNGTVLVLNGTLNKGRVYTETATVTTVGTDAVTFVQTSVTGSTYTADEVTLTLSGSVFSVKALGIANAQVSATAGIVRSKLDFGSGLVNADIATGAAIAYAKLNLATSIVNADIAAGAAIVGSKLDGVSTLGRVALLSSGTLTGGALFEVLTHNLNTRNVNVVIRNNSSPWDRIGVTDEATTVNTVTIRSDALVLPAGYTWTITGR